MHRLPGNVVPYGHRRMKDKPEVGCGGAKIDDVTAQDHRVRDGDIDVFDGAHTCHQQGFFDDIPRGVSNFHTISDLERTHVREHNAPDHVRNRGCGPEREQNTEKDRDTLESRGI